MGIYDRDYYHEEPPRTPLGSYSMVTYLILINVGIFLVELFYQQLVEWGELHADMWRHPLQFWQLISYGFLHDPESIAHVGFNMFGLWIFGREVETIYGKAEFLRVYLAIIALAGLTWMLFENVFRPQDLSPLIGASGGVIGIMILFVCHFPRRTFLMFPLPIPIPAWALAGIYILIDVTGVLASRGPNAMGDDKVAHVAHLAGAAFGYLYYRSGWNLGQMFGGRYLLGLLRLRPRLRIHDPEADQRALGQQVDHILEKISREGEASLTRKERRTLVKASRRYQQKRP